MHAQVTSGLGRNGPWLQNQWLRVETRQSDGSISPVALDGGFRPSERAVAFIEPADAPQMSFERSDYDVRPYSDALGGGRALTLTSRVPRRGVTLAREVVVYDAHPFWVTRVGVSNDGRVPLTVAALHAFSTPSEGRGRLQRASPTPELRVYRHGWQSWSPTMSLGGAEVDLRSPPPVQSPEAPQDTPGHFASDDVGVLFDPALGRSLLAGAVTARDFLTRIFIDAPDSAIDARCITDGISVAPGETLWSERIGIDLCGSPTEQLERYGDTLGRLMDARVPHPTPSGWCSWYYFYTTVTEEDVVRNLRFLEQHRRELPIETVQIDDGYQADIGDWLTANEKFPHGMGWLASEIKRSGYKPGIWLAPLLVAETSQTFAEHRDWLVGGDDGEPALAISNWQRRNYGLDGSHPEARDWLRQLFREVCDGWGYDYVKIDFLYAAAIAGRRYDPQTTRVRAYRDAISAIRDTVGDRRFVLGCGSLMAPSVGVFDGNRIGPDVAPFWRNLTHEERSRPLVPPRRPDDNSSVEVSIRNTLSRWWMHGRLWANDPDCLLVRGGRTKLSVDEVGSLAAAVGLSGGMMLSSDDLDKVSPERLELISMLLPPLPRSAVPVDVIERDMPERFEVAFDGPGGPFRLVGLFNFEDTAEDLTFPLPGGRWDAVELWEERYLGVLEGQIEFPLVAPHACRVVALRPVANAPALLATTAHVGMGALDVESSEYDVVELKLRMRLTPAGRARRRVFFATGGRSPRGARLDGQPLAIGGGGALGSVDVSVDMPCLLEVEFE